MWLVQRVELQPFLCSYSEKASARFNTAIGRGGISDKNTISACIHGNQTCGASAPDHLHFQAGTNGILPLQTNWQRLSRNLTDIISLNDEEKISVVRDFIVPAFVIISKSAESDECSYGCQTSHHYFLHDRLLILFVFYILRPS